VAVFGYVGDKQPNISSYAADSRNDQILADSSNWVQLGEHSITSGIATYVATEYSIVGTSTDTTYNASFVIDIAWPKLYFTAREDDVVAQAGTLSAWALIQ